MMRRLLTDAGLVVHGMGALPATPAVASSLIEQLRSLAATSIFHNSQREASLQPEATWTCTAAQLCNTCSFQFARGLKVYKRRYELPASIKSILVDEIKKARERPSPPDVPEPEPRPLLSTSRRVGAIAYKAGMTQEWNEHGVRVPLTVLWIDDCQVVDYKWPAMHGYWALLLGAGCKKQKNLHPGQAGLFLKQELPFKAVLKEFMVSEDAMLPVGTQITAAHFRAGQHIDLQGWSKNKGFQGVMKRWNFSGLPASHGVSLAHRSPGSIGNRTSPGKVWKGKKMPGQMGDEKTTIHNCLVYKVDPSRNLVYVRGQVPGPAGQEVFIRDALNTRHESRVTWELPFPTYLGPGAACFSDLGRSGMAVALAAAAGEELPPEALALLPPPDAVRDVEVFRKSKDPYIPYSKETDYFEVKWKKGD